MASGTDTFIIRVGDGSTTLANANVITDFNSNGELIGLDNNLNFSQLTIEQGTGTYENDVLISVTNTGEYLLILKGVNVNDITDLDFTAVDIDESVANAKKIDDDNDNTPIPNPDDTTPNHDGNTNPRDIGLLTWSDWMEVFNYSPVHLPDSVLINNSNVSNLDDFEGILDLTESLELDFESLSGDPIDSIVSQVKTIDSSVPELVIDIDWDPISDTEELYYTPEVV